MKTKPSATEPFIHSECEITDSIFCAYVEIDKGCRLNNSKFANSAAFSRIEATDHPLHTASLDHFMYRSDDYWPDLGRDAAFFAHRKSRTATIGHDRWIGAGAKIKPEVTLGDGAVVAAGTVVTKDVDPYTIVAGTPAKPLRLRQPREIAQRLIALAWWDWSHEQLRQTLDDFRNLRAAALLEKYETVYQ